MVVVFDRHYRFANVDEVFFFEYSCSYVLVYLVGEFVCSCDYQHFVHSVLSVFAAKGVFQVEGFDFGDFLLVCGFEDWQLYSVVCQ